MSETKEQVFEALLKDSQFDLEWWRKRYEKAERFGRGHDVDDLYEVAHLDSIKAEKWNSLRENAY